MVESQISSPSEELNDHSKASDNDENHEFYAKFWDVRRKIIRMPIFVELSSKCSRWEYILTKRRLEIEFTKKELVEVIMLNEEVEVKTNLDVSQLHVVDLIGVETSRNSLEHLGIVSRPFVCNLEGITSGELLWNSLWKVNFEVVLMIAYQS